MRIWACSLMPNHWHLLLWPEHAGGLARFMQHLTITHVRPWQEHRGYAGLGHIDRGRFQSFPVESDEQFCVMARYVERNARTCPTYSECRGMAMVEFVASRSRHGGRASLLATWPIKRPPDWVERVNRTDDERELKPLRQSVHRGRPFGRQESLKPIAKRLGLESAYHPSGRPPTIGRFENGPWTGSKAHHETNLTRSILHLALLAAVSLMVSAGIAAAVAGRHEETHFTDTGPVPAFRLPSSLRFLDGVQRILGHPRVVLTCDRPAHRQGPWR